MMEELGTLFIHTLAPLAAFAVLLFFWNLWVAPLRIARDETASLQAQIDEYRLPIRLTPMTATCRVPPLSRVKLGIGWSRGVARDAEQ